MTRLAVALALVLGCSDWEPDHTLTSFYLSTIDGEPLPAHPLDLPEGYLIESASLSFVSADRPRENDDDFVTYTTRLIAPDQEVATSSVQLAYTLNGHDISINLCPPLALCLVPTALVGTIDDGGMTVRHYYGNEPKSLYHFIEARPE